MQPFELAVPLRLARSNALRRTPALMILTASRDSPTGPRRRKLRPFSEPAADQFARRRVPASARHGRCRCTQCVTAQQTAALGVAQRQVLAMRAVAGQEPALEVDAPQRVGTAAPGKRRAAPAQLALDRHPSRANSPPIVLAAGDTVWGSSRSSQAVVTCAEPLGEGTEPATQQRSGVTLVSVVVVNYNTRDELRACLGSLSHGYPVVVVDNASTDGSAEMVRREAPHVHLLEAPRNLGYGGGANLGISATDSEYVLLLNSDTLVPEGAVERLCACLSSQPRAAVSGPRLLFLDGRLQVSCFPFPGTLAWLIENKPLSAVAKRLPWLRRSAISLSPPAASAPVPWVLGAALLLRRTALDQVGGFDQNFFMYYEEVDLCRRLARAGWSTWFVPEAEIVHVGGASTSKGRVSMRLAHFRSTLRYYRRYYRGPFLAFWTGIIRLKMLLRLVRDCLLLPASSVLRRPILRENIRAWARALVEKGD